MTASGLRSPASVPVRLLFDGQSHNLIPPNEGSILGRGYPYWVTRGRGIPWGVVAISGTSWTDLATTVSTRLNPYLTRATTTVLLMSGGTADINAGDTGAQLYADEVAYADAARTAGADIVIACTLIGTTAFDSGENTARLDHNTLLLADAESAFDGVADVDAAFVAAYGASYWTDTDVLFDGVHMFGDSAILYAATVAPVLDAALSSGYVDLYSDIYA